MVLPILTQKYVLCVFIRMFLATYSVGLLEDLRILWYEEKQ